MLGLSMNKSIKTTLILIAFLLALSTHSLWGFQGRPLVLQFTNSYYYAVGRLEILA